MSKCIGSPAFGAGCRQPITAAEKPKAITIHLVDIDGVSKESPSGKSIRREAHGPLVGAFHHKCWVIALKARFRTKTINPYEADLNFLNADDLKEYGITAEEAAELSRTQSVEANDRSTVNRQWRSNYNSGSVRQHEVDEAADETEPRDPNDNHWSNVGDDVHAELEDLI